MDKELEYILSRPLTKRQLEILQRLTDNEHDDYEGMIVYEKGVAFIGDDRIASRTVFALLRACVIRKLDDSKINIEHYMISETGKQRLAGASTAAPDAGRMGQ